MAPVILWSRFLFVHAGRGGSRVGCLLYGHHCPAIKLSITYHSVHAFVSRSDDCFAYEVTLFQSHDELLMS